MVIHDPDCENADEDFINGNCEIDCYEEEEDYDELMGRDDYKDYE